MTAALASLPDWTPFAIIGGLIVLWLGMVLTTLGLCRNAAAYDEQTDQYAARFVADERRAS